jgi:hypothetical protein
MMKKLGKLLAALLLAALLPGVLSAQAQNAKKPEFEVASVRPSSPDTRLESFVPTLNVAPGTTLRIVNRQLKELIMIAYELADASSPGRSG